MNYSALATSLLLIFAGQFTGQASAQSADAPPTTPGNLRATLYSNAGGELFWERSTDDRGAVIGYEITINGEDFGVLDALSLYEPSLLPNITYNISVVAIDNAGQRSTPAMTTLGDTGSITEPPANGSLDAPAELRSAVYSNTAAELFWRREPAAAALQYEIRLDGTVVGTTGGVSFFTADLAAGRDFLFEVIAIARDGTRSNSSSITVRTDSVTDSPSTSLAAPSNLRADVYSGTAAELFWNRSATPRLSYEIVRNGELLGSTDGTSFFDDTLVNGVLYEYEVRAIDNNTRSTASTLMLRAGSTEQQPPTDNENENPFVEPDPAGATVLARLGYPAARDLATGLVRADYLDLFFDVEEAALALLTDNTEEEISAQCPGGGTVQGIDFFTFSTLDFNDCGIDGRVLSGSIEIERNRFPTAATGVEQREYRFDALSVDAGDAGRFVATGTISAGESSGQNAVCDRSQSGSDITTIETASVEMNGDTFLISNSTFSQDNSRQDGPQFAQDSSECFTNRSFSFAGSATVSSDSFGASAASIEINGETSVFEDSDGIEESFVVAPTIEADFNDGSMLAVTATQEGEDTVQVDLVSDGAAISFEDSFRFERRSEVLQFL